MPLFMDNQKMKCLLAATLLSLISCAANAEAEKAISVLCKGVRSMTFWPSLNTIRDPLTTTYLFTFEKNPKDNNAMAWAMQKNSESKIYPWEWKASPILQSFSILISDNFILIESDFSNEHFAHKGKEKINRLSGEWGYEATNYNKNKESINREIETAVSITGTCEAAKPKF